MKRFALVLCCGCGVVAALLGYPRPAHAAGPAAAVFVQTNDPRGNAVVAYRRNADGTLTRRGAVATGGLGGAAAGAVSDTLASQGSLVYDAAHRLLLAVNAGSNSVSVLGVDGNTLHLRQIVPSGGDFPVSVAVHGGLVYVLNGGGDGRLQGYGVRGRRLVAVFDGNRSL